MFKGGQRAAQNIFEFFILSFMSIVFFTKIFEHKGTHIGILGRRHDLIELAK